MKTFLSPEFSSNDVFLIIKCVTFRLKKFLENKKVYRKIIPLPKDYYYQLKI